MSVSSLYSRAERLLAQRLLPGRDDKKIQQSLSELETIIKSISKIPTPHAKAAKQRLISTCTHKFNHAERVAFGTLPTQTVKNGLDEYISRLGEIIESSTQQKQNPRRLIIPYKSLQQQRAAATLGINAQEFGHIPYGYLQVSGQEIRDIQRESQKLQMPIAVEKHYSITPMKGIRQEDAWNLDLIGARDAWSRTRGEGINIAIIDTGCDYNHEEISNRFEADKGFNFVSDTPDPYDDNGHGTHVAGSAAGNEYGVAPESTLYALKFLDEFGRGYEVDFIRAAEWAIDNDVHVVNGSFGSPAASPGEQAICDELAKRSIVFAAAAGNNGSTGYSYPASYDSVISVAAIDRHKQHAHFSQRNDQVAISAPGVDVYSCVPGGYDTYSGTSMACPHIAGALALTSAEKIMDTAEQLGEKHKFGRGLVRADIATMARRVA